MEAPTLARICAIAAMLGGVAIAVSGTIDYAIDDDAPLSVTAGTPAWAAMGGAMFAAAVLLAFAQPGLYLAQKEKAGTWGVVALVLGSLGFAVFIGLAFVLAFVAPSVAPAAPGFLDAEGGPGGPLGVAFAVGFPLLLVALLAVGGVTFWANVLPRPASGLVLAGAVLDLVGGALPIAVDGRILAGVGFAWLGWAVWRMATSAPAADAPAATAA